MKVYVVSETWQSPIDEDDNYIITKAVFGTLEKAQEQLKLYYKQDIEWFISTYKITEDMLGEKDLGDDYKYSIVEYDLGYIINIIEEFELQ